MFFIIDSKPWQRE